jgi:uridine phosphorylase
MPFPNFAGKHAHDAFFSPADFVEYRREQGPYPDFIVPEGVILSYQSSLVRHIVATDETEQADFANGMALLSDTDGRIGVVGGFGIGAPAAAAVLEELIALGVRRFVSLGTAGSLQKGLAIGDLTVCDRAIRDEGVSHHYLAGEMFSHPSPELTATFAEQIEQLGHDPVVGPSWTIDTPYRETVEEARHYQQEGVLTVEMEAAALFAVAQYRGVEIASGFAISDSLAELTWTPRFSSDETKHGLVTLYRAAVATLLAG